MDASQPYRIAPNGRRRRLPTFGTHQHEHVVEIDYPRVVEGSSTSRQGTPSLSSQPKQDRPTRERDRLDLPHQSYVQVPTFALN